MDANSGEPWSEMDISDLTNELNRGRTFAETASFLCRDEDEVRQKAGALGLAEQVSAFGWFGKSSSPRRRH